MKMWNLNENKRPISQGILRNYFNFIFFQELMSGIKIFTGSTAAHWFIKNMEGVSSMQNAQVMFYGGIYM